MQNKIYLLIALLFALNAKSQVTNKILDLNSKVITELNEPLIAAIDRHIKVSKAKRIINKDDFYILVSIFPYINERAIPKPIFDSIYAINDFKTKFPIDSLTPVYSISIILASKRFYTVGWMGFDRKNTYYFKYKNYDILLSSNLKLIFENESEYKHISHQLILKQVFFKNSTYKFRTGYCLWNRYITEIRLKDLIWPIWTDKHDDFR